MKWSKLKQLVLNKIVPTPEEESKLDSFLIALLHDVNFILKEAGIPGKAEIHGSVAHGTWISGKQDLDVFIVLDSKDRRILRKVLDLISQKIEGEFVEAYAEHPYLQSKVNGFTVDFVPCFSINIGEEIISATDRTPLHTEYLKDKLDHEKKQEVRLLKQFTRGIGVYGAEIKIGGFSGYLCELLILKYRTFWNLLEASRKWKEGLVLSLNEQEEGDFSDPLVFTDPVDPGRNVASALENESFWTFIYASERFIKEPKKYFFFPEKEKTSSIRLIKQIQDRKVDFIFLVVEESRVKVPDVLYGMLYKSQEGLRKALERGNFAVLRSSVWSNELSRHIFIFELSGVTIPNVEKHIGPPARFREGADDFIKRYLSFDNTVSGPSLENDSWYVLKKRDHTNALEFLREKLKDGGIGIGVSRHLARSILKNHKLVLNEKIEEYLNEDLILHLNRFLKGRPFWLE